MLKEIAPYLSLAITLIGMGTMVWKRWGAFSKLRSDVESCHKDSENKNDMQQKDIDLLLENKKDVWVKLNSHESRIWASDVMFAKLEAQMKGLTDLMERIENKLWK